MKSAVSGRRFFKRRGSQRTRHGYGEIDMFLKRLRDPGVAAAFMMASATAATAFTACQVTDVGGIDDAGFNQTAWKGVQTQWLNMALTAAIWNHSPRRTTSRT